MAAQLTTAVFLWSEQHPEDGRNTGRNMLVIMLWKKYVLDYSSASVTFLYTGSAKKMYTHFNERKL